MQTVQQVITDLVVEAARLAGHEADITPEPAVATNNPKFGDYQSNHAFRLGKALKTNPRALAESVKSALPEHPAVAEASVAGPGFLNFRLDDGWVAAYTAQLAEDPHLGVPQTGAGQRVVVDYSGPNVAKRMHVGHMRSTLIGNALCRILKGAGYRVIGDNHIGDWGTQFGKLMVAWRGWRDEAAYEADPIGELERLYTSFSEKASEEPSLEDAAREETAKLQAGDEENNRLWRQFIDVSMAEFNRVYERLDIEFEATLGESAYNDHLPTVVADLKERGIAEVSDGASVVKWDEAAEGGLKDTVLVIQKQDGAYLYGTTDLATLDYRHQTWEPARIIYVTDTRQQLHFRQVFDIWSRWKGRTATLEHAWFGMLRFGDSVMASRTGNIVRFVDLLDEGVRRAREVVDAKARDLSEQERAEIAEAVGMAAIRYSDLSQNPQSDVLFDWDRILSLEGNTAPYLMYSYARCRSIQRKGEVVDPEVQGLEITDAHERELMLHLMRLPEAVHGAAETLRPNLLCDYLYNTATLYNRFHKHCPVLTAEPPVRASRLALVEATARVLEGGFSMLGLPALQRM